MFLLGIRSRMDFDAVIFRDATSLQRCNVLMFRVLYVTLPSGRWISIGMGCLWTRRESLCFCFWNHGDVLKSNFSSFSSAYVIRIPAYRASDFINNILSGAFKTDPRITSVKRFAP